MIEIYIDVYFFINFAVDFLALYSSAKFIILPYSSFRLSIGAILGGIWSIIFLFFPMLFFLHLPVAFFMVLLSCGKRKSLRATLFFIFFEMLFGGIITGVQKLFEFLPNSSLFTVILLCILLSFLLFSAFELYIKKRIYTVGIAVRIEELRLTLLIDSGNLAIDSITGRRIIFTKIRFPDSVHNHKIPIPIKTATGTKIKYGFIPDKIHFEDKRYNSEKYIVVPDNEGCEFGGYDGIIGVI